MSAVLPLLLALVAGLGLGLFYFGGLWLTVQRLGRTRNPTLLFAFSLLVRTALAVWGMYLVMGGSWHCMLSCRGGSSSRRQLMIWRLRPGRLPQVQREDVEL